MYAKIDINSNFSSVGQYAPAGALVDIISYTSPVYICEYEGKRFSCHEDKLGNKPPIITEIIEVKPFDLFNQCI